jgi:hypothetical protein
LKRAIPVLVGRNTSHRTYAFRKRPGRAPRLADAAARLRSKVEWSIPRSRAARQGRWARSFIQQRSPKSWESARMSTESPFDYDAADCHRGAVPRYRLPRRRRGGEAAHAVLISSEMGAIRDTTRGPSVTPPEGHG